MPLYEVKLNFDNAKAISDVIDTSLFINAEDVRQDRMFWGLLNDERWTDISTQFPDSHFKISLYLDDDMKSAEDEFYSECGLYAEDVSEHLLTEPRADVEYGGEEGNRYCLTSIMQLRNPELFCAATHTYESAVVFQKGRLVITIVEDFFSEDFVPGKNIVIERLAKELENWQGNH